MGAAIDLGFCLDLLTSNGIEAVRAAYADFDESAKANRKPRPTNAGGDDLLLRRLDCAVLRHLHGIRAAARLQSFDTVRGVFIEGTSIYPDSGFREKTHVQVCVLNPLAIKGVFRVPEIDL